MVKYSKKHHINALLKRGNIRIGTLHEYRNSEYEEGIHDNSEGLKRVHIRGRELDLSDKNPNARNIKENFLGGCIQGNVRFILNGECEEADLPSIFVREVDTPNCLVFCASAKRNELVPKIFKYDAGVKIINPEKFIETLSKHLKILHGAELIYFDKIKYYTKDELWNGSDFGENPMFYKDESFAYQDEIRAIWKMPTSKVDPVILEIPELTKYCHQIRLN